MSEEKKLKNYLHYYLGCQVRTSTGKLTLTGINVSDFYHTAEAIVLNGNVSHKTDIIGLKPILRPLFSITEEEFEELVIITMSAHNLPEADRISKKELHTRLLLDKLPEYLMAEISLRCFEGYFILNPDGSINIEDENEEDQPVSNQPMAIDYLLKKHFDLFGLIEAGLAVKK